MCHVKGRGLGFQGVPGVQNTCANLIIYNISIGSSLFLSGRNYIAVFLSDNIEVYEYELSCEAPMQNV